MKNKIKAGIVLSVIVSAMATQAAIIIQDDFDGMSAGENITNSVLEIGSGTWVGSLESNGGNIMRAPASPSIMEGASIALPTFTPGDIITITASAARTDTNTSWFGMGFSDSSDVISSLANDTPWATFSPVSGGANVFSGPSTANASGTLIRPSGGVGTAVTEMQFIYDTGAGTVTIVYGGETVHDGVVITPVGTPTLDHAFFVMRTPDGGGPPGSYLVNFEVSVEAATVGTTIIWDDFAGMTAGANVSNSVLEVGSGTWSGRLISDGHQVMRVPETHVVNEGGSINLPDFSPGAVISIKAKIGLSDSAGWWGIGFTDAPYAPTASLASNSPWANFRPSGAVNVFGGLSTANAAGNLVRTNGAVSGVFYIEFIYDTGAGTVTTFSDGEMVHDSVAVTTSGTPTLDYAFIYFYDAASGGTTNGTYVDNFKVSILSDSSPGYATWAAGWGIDIGAETADPDGDGLLNIYEYGLGGDPTNGLDQGTSPVFGIENVGGTNYFGYIHPQLSDPASGLSYSLALRTDLMLGDWTTNAGYVVTGTNVTGGAFDFVTNVTDTVDDKKFIHLIIE